MEKLKRNLLIVCPTVFCLATAFAGQSNDEPPLVNVHVRDYCDPATFNAVLGPGACIRDTASGAITFPGFQAELGADKSVGAWRFAPQSVNAEKGVSLTLESLGGETHTFTRVEKFGGGFVAPLNAAAGTPVPAPECAQLVNGGLVPQPPGPANIFLPHGAKANGPQIKEGESAKFQCCIHPWMRMTISSEGQNSDSRTQH